MIDWDYSTTWYHGSPRELTTLHKGSTITQDRRLAEVFSHRPTLVSISDGGEIKHDGTTPGFLYAIAEVVQPDDVNPHPHSSMEYGKEWLTHRELRVRLIGSTVTTACERLTEGEIEELQRRLQT